ncbi:MAG: hypothetical protein K6G62_06420 [Eubacterium sp.]|nr:hypothetical protein [Eubacterium sp.]
MANRNMPYNYGSAARKLQAAQPLRRRQEEIRREQQRQRRAVPKKKIDKVSVILTIITFAAVMFVGMFYIRLQFQSTYLSESVVNLQSEVTNLEKDNAVAEMELDSKLNLQEIYNKAVKELGMTQPKDNQVFTYESKKSTQVRQYSPITE